MLYTQLPQAEVGEEICRAEHHRGYVCTRKDAHRGDHGAHDPDGVLVMHWRGGKSRWAASARRVQHTE